MKTTVCTVVLVLLSGSIRTATSQSFSSGSSGSDGALNLTTPGTIIFDPKDTATFGRVLDSDADNIYHFTTINIAAGVTLKLRGDIVNGPVFWLAQGAVQIDGIIDLSGQSSTYTVGSPAADRVPTIPGPGGYGGGVGPFGSNPAQPGFGPGGGTTAGCINDGGNSAGAVGTTANDFLVPLIGGSGGGGNSSGGGAGGGAILIASSASISLKGTINARGGNTATRSAGAGAGGSIRLVAPSISGDGTFDVRGNNSNVCGAYDGIVRLEAFQLTFSGAVLSVLFNPPRLFRATPFGTFLPTAAPPSIRVASVAGVPVPPNPTGSFTLPDVTINSSSSVPFTIEAKNIPIGTVVSLRIISENGPDITTNSSPLAGATAALSTATASATLPPGFSHGFVKATWIQ